MKGWLLIETLLVLLANAIVWFVTARGGQARTNPVGGLPGRVRRGLKVREPFGPHSVLFAESEGKVRWRSARTNPAVLPA
jgi:hypothetical protein